VQVKVSDSGCGIAPEHLNRIFDAFFTTKGPSGGRGLGLALVSDTTNAWNGVICVDSFPAKGATFTLYFPPIQLSIPVEQPSPESLPRGTGQRVLFVDDEETLGLVVAESLFSLGYHASFAPTPELALEKNQRERFDIVITDLNMPRMTGVELARTLWKTKPQQRVILTTGLSGKLTPEAAYAFGFAGLLVKPFKKSALASALQIALTQETIAKTIAC
jgi:CheY-like chemotaxis protein